MSVLGGSFTTVIVLELQCFKTKLASPAVGSPIHNSETPQVDSTCNIAIGVYPDRDKLDFSASHLVNLVHTYKCTVSKHQTFLLPRSPPSATKLVNCKDINKLC